MSMKYPKTIRKIPTKCGNTIVVRSFVDLPEQLEKKIVAKK